MLQTAASSNKLSTSRSQTRDSVNNPDVAGRHGSGARALVREKASSVSSTRRTQIQQGSQASAGDAATDSRPRALDMALKNGNEAAPGL